MNNNPETMPSQADKRFLVGMAGLAVLALILLVNAVALAREYEYEGWSGPLIMMAAVVTGTVWLPVGMALNAGPVRSRFTRLFFGRVMLVAGGLASAFWVVVPMLVLSGNLYYTHASPEELSGVGMAILGAPRSPDWY